jgi:hypothetical protein
VCESGVVGGKKEFGAISQVSSVWDCFFFVSFVVPHPFAFFFLLPFSLLLPLIRYLIFEFYLFSSIFYPSHQEIEMKNGFMNRLCLFFNLFLFFSIFLSFFCFPFFYYVFPSFLLSYFLSKLIKISMFTPPAICASPHDPLFVVSVPFFFSFHPLHSIFLRNEVLQNDKTDEVRRTMM